MPLHLGHGLEEAESTDRMKEQPSAGLVEPPPRIPDDLRHFYAQHGVDVNRLHLPATKEPSKACFPSRFVRLNPRFDTNETLDKLSNELDALPKGSSSTYRPLPVPWLDPKLEFYALPGDFSLSQSQCYQEGRVYGMDVSSGAAIAVLLSPRYDRYPETASPHSPSSGPFRALDLCCAPGLKLCALADYLESNPNNNNNNNNSVVVGVDVSKHRIAITKRILHKYRMKSSPQDTDDNKDPLVHIRLYCADGTTFDRCHANNLPKLVFDSRAAREECVVNGTRKRMNKSARAREGKRLQNMATVDFCPDASPPLWKPHLFDRVLVDAECSTDGSLKHIQKQIHANGAAVVAPMLTNVQKLADLVQLQQQLAAAGFRLLKPGGTMVYSTCSLSQDQNEDVVRWLLREFSDSAVRIPLDFSSALRCSGEDATNPQIKENEWGVRFVPNLPPQEKPSSDGPTEASQLFFGGGFFISKIGKRSPTSEL